jgi:hypothetical protein
MAIRTRSRIGLLSLLLLAAGTVTFHAQDSQLRMIIGANAVCRAEPNETAAVAARPFRMGDILTVTKQQDVGGVAWYRDDSQSSGTCWVYGPLTAEFSPASPEAALLAIFDRLEQRPEPVSFVEFVEVTNLLEDDFAGAVTTSGFLQFRKLKLIAKGLSGPEARDQVLSRDPLKKAWILSHQDILKFSQPTDTWSIQPLMYWRLYDSYSQTMWAEDLAQTAALGQPYKEDCSPQCLLSAIFDGPVQYWSRRPNGAAIARALQQSAAMARHAADNACRNRTADPPVPAALVGQIRDSLATVTSPGKQDVLQALSDAETKCSAQKAP